MSDGISGAPGLTIPTIEDGISILDAALAYAAAGWYVLPIKPETKHAGSVLGTGWPDKTSRDPKQIVAWYAAAESDRYGVALHVGKSGAWVADVDHPEALPVELREAIERDGLIQWTREGGARYQAVFMQPIGRTLGNSAGALAGPWGDVRGKNGIIVVEPTIHPKANEGGRYRWQRAGAVPLMDERVASALPDVGAGAATAGASAAEVAEWVREHGAGERVELVKGPLNAFRDKAGTGQHGDGRGARHGAALDSACWIVREAGAGLYPAGAALSELGSLFVTAIGSDRDGKTEWQSIVRYAVGSVAGADLARIRERLAERPAGLGSDGLPIVVELDAPTGNPSGERPEDPGGSAPAGAPEVDVMNPPDRVADLMSRWLTVDQLKNLPNPEPLIFDMLNMNSECWIIGAPESFKSFVALDMACHVASGQLWQGRQTRKGRVVYVAAEGAQGMKLRVEAWERQYGPIGDQLVFQPEPTQVGAPAAWDLLVEGCRRYEAAFIVLDTQARITAGLDENSVKDMGLLIEAVRRLRVATGACVLVVHHVGRNGGDARGSSAIDGAQDTEIRVERPKGEKESLKALVSLDKQKDGDSTAGTVAIQMVVNDLGSDPVSGRRLSSLTLKPAEVLEGATLPRRLAPDWKENLVKNQRIIVDVIYDHFDVFGETKARISARCKDRGMAPGGSFDTAWTALLKKKLLVQIEGQQRYTLRSLVEATGYGDDYSAIEGHRT